jgi:hypothetical protein
VHRVKDVNYPDAMFPVWRYHPFFTNSDLPIVDADIVHRNHAIVETVFADLIDGPLAHVPSGRFGANSAWVLCAAITHNLLRAAGTLCGGSHAVARGATCADTWSTSPSDSPDQHGQRPRPIRQTSTQTSTSPDHPLATAGPMQNALAQRHRIRTIGSGLTGHRGCPGLDQGTTWMS